MIEKPKKERRFLKILGKVGEILVQELLIKVGKSLIQKIGGKKNLPSIIFLSLFYNIAFASIDSIPYPITTNKQRLGWQTSGNGLVYRGRASDTITKPSNYANKDIKAYMLVDTVNNVMYSYIASKGGWKFNNSDTVIIQGATMPFDSITFNTAKNGTVGVGEVEYNDTQGSLIQGLKGGNVTNVIGQQLHQRVNNRTGAPLAKGDVVYLSGSQGNRITVAKALATSDPTSANTFGIVAESIADNQSGYIITEGLITGLNTSALIQDSAVYLSGTTAGALTSIKPQAPIHGVYIGVCVKSNAGSGEIFVKIRNGQELDELHDVQITSPVNNSSLYYKSSEGLWLDTTAALLVSDTTSMLTPYLRKLDTVSLSNRINLKLNISDTVSMLTNYLRSGVASLTYTPLTRFISTTSPLQGGGDLSTNRTLSILSASDIQSGIVNTTAQLFSGSKVFKHRLTADSLFYLNNTSPIPTAILGIDLTGGVNSVGKFTLGNGLSITSSTLLADTNLLVTKFDTAAMLTPYFRDADTTSLNLTSRFAAKLNLSDTASMLSNYLRTGVAASTYLPLTGGTLSGSILNSWTYAYSSAPRNDGAVRRTYTQNLYSANGGTTDRVTHYYTFSSDECCASAPVTMYYGRFNGFYNQANIIYDASIYYHNNNQFYYRAFSEPENKVTFSIKPSTTVNSISGTKADLYLSGDAQIDRSLNIGTTLGVTGATTLSDDLILRTSGGSRFQTAIRHYYEQQSRYAGEIQFLPSGSSGSALAFITNQSGFGQSERMRISETGNVGIGTNNPLSKLEVDGSAVFNEGSADADFRVESDGNANMVFVDASTDRVGIGTNSPTKTLEVNGEVKIATTTATPTSLLGKDGSNVVGNVRVITPLTLAGDSINLNTVPISKGGTGSTSESGARSNLGVGYVFYASTAGDAIQLSSNKVFIVNSGGASTTTINLGTATAGRLYMIKNLATGTVVSNSSNVIPLNGGSAGTAILSAGNTTTQWCSLVCDGTNWHIMQSN